MHWRHETDNKVSEKFFTPDQTCKYADTYFSDYYCTDAPLTLKTFGLCSRSPNSHIINRYVEKYILHYVLSGKGWCNGVPFEENDIIYCTNSIPYNISSDRSDPCTYAWISFNGGKSERYLEQMGLIQPFTCYKSANPDKIVNILYDMMEIQHADVEQALYLESCFLHLLSLSVPPPQESKTNPTGKKNRINSAIQYIAQNYQNPNLRLSQIAEASYTNEKYLQRIFKSKLGISVHQYISKLRLDAAINLLSSSNYNINEISEFVGYNDRRTFSEAFKKRFGVSPTGYVPL